MCGLYNQGEGSQILCKLASLKKETSNSSLTSNPFGRRLAENADVARLSFAVQGKFLNAPPMCLTQNDAIISPQHKFHN